MSNRGSIAITGAILITSVILISATAASLLGSESEETSEEDLIEYYNQVVDETIDEITTYLQITDKLGKYYGVPHQQKIEKIAIMVKPLISIDIDISELTIKLCDGNTVKILNYSGNAESIGSQSLFGHSLWNGLSEGTFGFIVTHDKDNSLVNYNTINKNTDMTYIVIKLSEEFALKKGDVLIVTLFPESGIQKTIKLEAPLPMRSIISFE